MKNSIKILSLLCLTVNQGLLSKSFMPSLDSARQKIASAITGPVLDFKKYLEKQKGSLSPDQEAVEIHKIMDLLFWSNQIDLVKTLQARVNQSKHEASIVLKDKIKAKYSKTPLLLFAQDLAREEEQLIDVLKILEKNSQAKLLLTRSKDLVEKYKLLNDRYVRLTQTLKDLTDITNILLMS